MNGKYSYSNCDYIDNNKNSDSVPNAFKYYKQDQNLIDMMMSLATTYKPISSKS